jgi:rRNA metabolism SBDS family protein
MSKYQLVRLAQGRIKLEVAAKMGTIRPYKEGNLSWNQVLMADQVFTNFNKGNVASSADLLAVCGKSDVDYCTKYIVDHGEPQVSASERKEDLDRKIHQVLCYVHSNYIDPKLGLPHPMARLEGAFANAKQRIDVNQSTQTQAEQFVKSLSGVLSMRKSIVEAKLRVQKALAGKVEGIIYKHGDMGTRSYGSEHTVFTVTLQPSQVDGFISNLNKVTNNEAYDLVFSNFSGEFADFVTSGEEVRPVAEGKQQRGKKKGKKKGKRKK